MNQIDYFCLFTNQAAAQADVTVGAYWNVTTWDLSQTFPGASITTAAALINGISSITGFWILISLVNSNASLDSHPNLVMKLDRNLAATNGAFVLSANISGTNRTNLTFKPVPHGSNYPRPLGK